MIPVSSSHTASHSTGSPTSRRRHPENLIVGVRYHDSMVRAGDRWVIARRPRSTPTGAAAPSRDLMRLRRKARRLCRGTIEPGREHHGPLVATPRPARLRSRTKGAEAASIAGFGAAASRVAAPRRRKRSQSMCHGTTRSTPRSRYARAVWRDGPYGVTVISSGPSDGGRSSAPLHRVAPRGPVPCSRVWS